VTGSTRWRRGYQGPLYLEVVPLSFPVRVREDLTLNQLRLSLGRPWLSDDDVAGGASRGTDSLSGWGTVPAESLVLSDGSFSGWTSTGMPKAESATARATVQPSRLTSEREVDPGPFWTRLSRGAVIDWCCRRSGFYLLMSHEA